MYKELTTKDTNHPLQMGPRFANDLLARHPVLKFFNARLLFIVLLKTAFRKPNVTSNSPKYVFALLFDAQKPPLKPLTISTITQSSYAAKNS
ncbi:hypothetical protein GCM10028809_20500 [Spirosoma gilvum]